MKKGIIVLSLFDGMSCGRIAFDRAGIKVKKYYASEIDKYAQIVSEKNYPDIIRLGDITKWKEWKIEKPDIIIGGSPCQGFSFAGKQLNFEDVRSKLFFVFADILKHYKPKYFLLENVRMKKEYQKVISDCLGVEPVEINSALVSAQNRKRLYWTNIPDVTQPTDKGIFLKDIIETGITEKDKSYCIDANYAKGSNYKQYSEKCRRQLIKNTVSSNGKSLALTSNANKTGSGVYILDGWRKLTPLECERLQTVNTIYEFENSYTNHVSNSQRYKMLGNGWTVDVIAHILRGLK
jgi:site-specific DNA-cytosine methylase